MADREQLRPQLPKRYKRPSADELVAERSTLQNLLIRIIESDGADRDLAIEEARSWLRKKHGRDYPLYKVIATEIWKPDDA
jgi:hypothetical protein